MTFLQAISSSIGGYGALIAIAGVVLGLLAIGKVFKTKKQGNMFLLLGIAMVVIPLIASGVFTGGTALFAAGISGGASPSGNNIATNLGDASTVYLKAYDNEADSKTLSVVPLTVFDSDGAILLDGTDGTSVSSTIGKKLNIYGEDNATWYTDAKLNYEITSAAPTVNLDTHKVTTTPTVTMYDDVMTVLTTGANNTDYNVSLSASQARIQYLKVENSLQNTLYKLGAICTYRTNATSINKVEVVEAGWNVVKIPKSVKDVSATLQVSNSAPTISYYECYAPSSPILLHEYDSITIKTRVEAGSNQPTAATTGAYGFLLLDTGSSKGKDNSMSVDYYVHDDDENVNQVGFSETPTTPYGGTGEIAVFGN